MDRIMAAIAAALSFASSMPTATTSAPFAAATTTDDRLDDRLSRFSLTRFLHANRNPFRSKTLCLWIPRPARALHPPPCRTRPAPSSPRAGHLFPVEIYGPCTQLGRRCAGVEKVGDGGHKLGVSERLGLHDSVGNTF